MWEADAMFIFRAFRASSLVLLALSIHCAGLCQTASDVEPESVFTLRAEGQGAILRALTRAAVCPRVAWDGKSARMMDLRAGPATIPARSDSSQIVSKEAVFDVLACEAAWPAGVKNARVAGQDLPAPHADIRRIVLIGDTGCRMKASENAFQPCNDALKWPFARVAQSAAALKPDLVVHVGDIHYRESPCPQGNAGCSNSIWGYGYDAWRADFFEPAKPLLAAAPWVFVRGNHESCHRAGQGWFRFIDLRAWSEERSCNDSAFDADADYSAPYAVPVAADTQLLVFDSSKTNGKPFAPSDRSYGQYSQQIQAVAHLARLKQNSFFLSHHPLLAVAPVKDPNRFKPAGNEGLQSVFSALYPDRLFPEGISVAMHGHVHLFESISFKSSHPLSLVLGNSGSAIEGLVPEVLPTGAKLYDGVEVHDYAARSGYGFATLDRIDFEAGGNWRLTEYTIDGVPVIECNISEGKSRCNNFNGPKK
jgi:hypothetical protein